MPKIAFDAAAPPELDGDEVVYDVDPATLDRLRAGEPGEGGPEPVSATRPVGRAWPGAVFDRPSSLLPDAAGMQELFDAVRERRPVRVEAAPAAAEFATITTTQSGRPARYLGGTGLPMPLRIIDLVGIPQEDVGWGATTAFPVLGAGTAPSGTAEGAAKLEYAAITAGSVTPSTLAVWTDVTGQVRSLASFEAKLRNKLARLIAMGENNLLRTAAAAGATAQAFTAGDQAVQILRAAATIEASVGVRPDLLIFNPADTLAIFGTSVSNAAPQEIAALSMRVFGMFALPMASQTAGFALVGAWSSCTRLVVGLGLTYMVDPYTQMKNNIVTILAEEAVNLAVEEPTGFTSVDIVTP